MIKETYQTYTQKNPKQIRRETAQGECVNTKETYTEETNANEIIRRDLA